jgi:hypothetical protein
MRALGGFNKEIQAQGFSPVTVGIGNLKIRISI